MDPAAPAAPLSGEGSKQPPPGDRPKKRRRPPLACEQCRHRKIRCDRTVPCGPCTKAKIPACTYAPSHVPASRSKRSSSQSRAHILHRPSSGGSLHSSNEFIRPSGGPFPLSAAQSRPGSKTGSTAASDDRDSLSQRVHYLEQKLADVVNLEAGRAARIEAEGFKAPHVKGTVSKTRYFGQSHFMNGADLFPLELGILGRAELEKDDIYDILVRCKALARTIKGSRLQPLSSINLGKSLPNRPLADHLVEAYLRTFEGVFRVLHVPSFRAEYERYWSNRDAASESFVILLQLVLAVGAAVYDDTFSLRPSATQWVYEAQLWMMLPPEKGRMTIVGIQIMCLICIARCTCGVGPDLVWISTGVLIRKALYMGLHRDPKQLSNMTTYRAEMRRRLWATILELNLQTSFDSGGAPLIDAKDYDARLPANLDDSQLTDEPDGGGPEGKAIEQPTDMSIQIILSKSLPLRLSLLKHVNDLRSTDSYDETLRYNSELTKACRSLSQTLITLKSNQKTLSTPKIRDFHAAIAEMLTYRCFHTLHQPVLVKSIKDPKFYFSRKMCLDGGLKLLNLCGIFGDRPPPATPTMDPAASDIDRVMANGAGIFRNIPLQSLFAIGLHLIHQTEEKSMSLGYFPTSDNADLSKALESALEYLARRAQAGETNVKASVFTAACLGHVEALEAGEDHEAMVDRIRRRVKAASQSMLELLEQRAKGDGLVVDLQGLKDDTAGFDGEPMIWMDDWAWAEPTGLDWPPWSQSQMDEMGFLMPN